MTKEELFKKVYDLSNALADKEVEAQLFVNSWLNDELYAITDENANQQIDLYDKQIEELKNLRDMANTAYVKFCEEEELRKQGLIFAKKNVQNQFGVNPDEIIITGGVLSSNANESHLTGRSKTPEELEAERQSALAEIRSRVINKEITLAEASKLKNDINLAYGYGQQTQDMSSGIHR